MSTRSIVLLIWLLALAIPASAEESPIPRLGDHVFVPAMTITEPFLTTHVQTSVILGQTINSTTPVFSLIDSTIIGTAKYSIFLTAVGFKYQHKVKEWLVAGFTLGAGGRLGTKTHTLLTDGITGFLKYNFQWKLRIHHSPSVLVSGSLNLGNSNATFINLLEWAQGILGGNDTPLVRSRNSLRGFGGLHAAWGMCRRFGLLGSFYLDYGESFDGRGDNAWHTDVRLGVSYDAAQDLKVPLGLALIGGHYDNDEGADANPGVWLWSARIALQSRSDFSIGLGLMTSYFNSMHQDAKLQLFQASIDIRYYY